MGRLKDRRAICAFGPILSDSVRPSQFNSRLQERAIVSEVVVAIFVTFLRSSLNPPIADRALSE